ncbi:MAG: hypothetical protein ACYC5F_08180 [Thermoleophilia bacterium]
MATVNLERLEQVESQMGLSQMASTAAFGLVRFRRNVRDEKTAKMLEQGIRLLNEVGKGKESLGKSKLGSSELTAVEAYLPLETSAPSIAEDLKQAKEILNAAIAVSLKKKSKAKKDTKLIENSYIINAQKLFNRIGKTYVRQGSKGRIEVEITNAEA